MPDCKQTVNLLSQCAGTCVKNQPLIRSFQNIFFCLMKVDWVGHFGKFMRGLCEIWPCFPLEIGSET